MTTADRPIVEFRLLGSVEAVRDGSTLPLGGPRQRALLALLLVAAGRPVLPGRLAEELWLGQPPAGVSATLRSYVSRLRRVLGADAVIIGDASGYTLEVPPEQLDAARFERLLREGQDALARGAAERAAERLRTGLGLWRGHPFAELGDEGALGLEAERLEELRLLALEARIEADLQLGMSAELVDELEALLAEHPYRERFWQQLMLALYRAQRQADSLAAYRRARTILDAELGLEPSDELKRLEQAILRHEVEAVTPPKQRHNLPAPVTSFVGREAELADVEGLLTGVRLVTLTGVGGAGKTRLALEAARRALPDFPDGVCFCDLSAVADPALVARQIAIALDVREQASVPLGDLLAVRLREQELLLLLDNCEHLRAACAQLAHDLLGACPRLRVLATSREPLGAPGETDYAVPPLALPAAEAAPDELRASEAVQLLLARARASRPRLADDDHAVTIAARICTDLDGLPLAIELAAARAKALSLDDIATRLNDRYRFLVSWRRLTTTRHRTLREAMDWSYELLTEDEQRLLARLSVFAGGFTLAAAADVCLEGDEEHALELVERLAAASLVIADERDGQMRYRLLETVRQYAGERLDDSGETAAFQRRHADVVLAFADDQWWKMAADRDTWAQTIGREYDNLRSALVWSRDADESEYLLRLTKDVWQFWWIRGDFSEGSGWLDTALQHSTEVEPGLRGSALEGAAGLAWAQGDLTRAGELAETGRSIFATAGDHRGELACTTVLGLVALSSADYGDAERIFERTLELADDLGGSHVALAFHNLGSVALGAGDLERAADRYEAARSRYGEGADRYGVALSDLYLGVVAAEDDRYDEAAEHLKLALPVFREIGFLQYTAQCLDGTAAVVHARGETVEAVRLLAAAAAIRERIGDAPTVAARLRERELASTLDDLGDEAFATAWAEGRALTEADAVERARRAVAG